MGATGEGGATGEVVADLRVHGRPGYDMPAAGGKRSSSSSSSEDTATTCKKFRSAIDETVAEFICPISQELPLEPVTAEDGRVYEKASIEEWLGRKQTSPVTNEPMGTKLLPAVQVRSVIRNLVRSGAISGDKADQWQQRIAQEDEFAEKKKAAEGGDAGCMNEVGVMYGEGEGVCKDTIPARRWCRKAAEHGSVRGLTNFSMMQRGPGNEHTMECWGLLTEAATRGDAWACVMIAGCFAKGRGGLPVDTEMAKRWYEKALKCTYENDGFGPNEDDERQANAWLGANTDVASTWKC